VNLKLCRNCGPVLTAHFFMEEVDGQEDPCSSCLQPLSMRSGTANRPGGSGTFPEPLTGGDSEGSERGFKSCPQERSAATVVMIGVLLKGFAGARNMLYLEFPWSVAELPAAS
jgi:hypothetical protein